ncbi:MAG: glutamate--tRNA ligase [Anaerolineae bacterium]|nr:glutamate--tRNA ligase [Anaerolineae bacterium]MBL8105989.1 glutamate--tRNA ligase [Anaerolineales bacterium]MCC7189084.1 glutamate--tRNA ligase [Anaerolineales bacterium]
MKPARTRMAPSPTGRFHLGSARTALFDYLLARKTGGQFILRLEDTDRKRFVEGSEDEIMRSLDWLGLTPDESPLHGGTFGPYRQTERRDLYQQRANELVQKGSAYPCFCSPERLEQSRKEQEARKVDRVLYDGLCRAIDPGDAAKRIANGEKYVIRFKMEHVGSTIAHDHLRGDIVTENKYLDDTIILKSDGLPTYHLAAMVDDHEMEITHVLRGSEWLSTFPLHVNIVRAFGWDEPVWIHLSIFLKPSGKGKMSKRDNADVMKDGRTVFVDDMKDLGYTPEGVLNWIALMGWGVAEDDVMSLDQMIQRFSIDTLTPSPAAINFQKLDHFNGTHIRLLTTEDLSARIKPYFVAAGLDVQNDALVKITPLIRERLVTLDDCLAFASFFFKEEVLPNPDELIAKGLDAKQSAEIAKKCLEILSAMPDVSHQTAEPPMRAYVESAGLNANQVFGILRVAVTGQKVSPPLFESMEIIGREKVLSRLQNAIGILERM